MIDQFATVSGVGQAVYVEQQVMIVANVTEGVLDMAPYAVLTADVMAGGVSVVEPVEFPQCLAEVDKVRERQSLLLFHPLRSHCVGYQASV